MLVQKIEDIATARGFIFGIGGSHWHNLMDVVNDVALPFAQKQVYLLLFTEKESRNYGEFSASSDKREAYFLLAVRSKVSDPSYKFKYDNHIKPLKELARDIEKMDFSICDDMSLATYSIEGWRENYLDTNLDCVEVRLTVNLI